MLIFLKPRKKRTVASKMPGSNTAARQERVKKTGARPTPPLLFTINEEDEQQKNGNSRKVKAPDGPHGKIQEKKMALSCNIKDSMLSKSEPHLILKVDDKQRLARERREEREKLIAARESFWLEKEVRARQHYEKHMEERKKKLEEQRIKEIRRRAAVDEKRKQKLEEEKKRHEEVVRRTMERSQKPKQKNTRWSWGGALQSNTSIPSTGYFVDSSLINIDLSDLAHHLQANGGVRRDPDRRSVSTMNLSKHVDPVINKRLSTSSATLLNSPDRGRRPQLSPWESSVVTRLLTPTHSYLARSKSTAALSGDAASCSPISPQPYKTPISKSSERLKLFITPDAIARRRTIHFTGTKSVEKKEKQETDRESGLPTSTSTVKISSSHSILKTKSPVPTSGVPTQKSTVTLFSISKPVPSPSNSSIKGATISQRPLSPGNVRPIKRDTKEDSKKKQEEKHPDFTANETTETKVLSPADVENTNEKRSSSPTEAMQDSPVLPSTPVIPSPTVPGKSFAGTTNPEEATRILAEKRRLAREQRERDEEEKREKEEEDRKRKEELVRREAEERAQREEEAKQQEAERKEKEEQERQEKEKLLKQLAEEKEQREQEEAERLQKQKEEANRIRIEREKHFQKEEQERSERKKRLEEIMKRTRRSETGDKQSNVERNGEISKTVESTAITPSQQEQESVFLQSPVETPHNGESLAPSPRIITLDSSEKQPNENGLCTPNNNFEEIINLPVGTKSIKLDSLNNEGNSIQDLPLSPIIAFEVDSVQTPQTAEVN
ncbi:ensconsin isoform X2 [Mixophyes fleayi]|uniref:ensconsin isoform X2 n=1 Tax=Mixophyes fleayi TaxID=3061075 RepID=UPI003F4D7DED